MKINQEKVAMDNKELEYKQAVRMKELELEERKQSLLEYEAGLKPQIEAAKIEATRYSADVKQETALAVEQLKGGASIQEAINTALGEQQVQNDAVLDHMLNGILGEMSNMRTENSEALNGVNAGFTEQLQTLAAQQARPRKIIYDSDGEPIGVETVTE